MFVCLDRGRERPSVLHALQAVDFIKEQVVGGATSADAAKAGRRRVRVKRANWEVSKNNCCFGSVCIFVRTSYRPICVLMDDCVQLCSAALNISSLKIFPVIFDSPQPRWEETRENLTLSHCLGKLYLVCPFLPAAGSLGGILNTAVQSTVWQVKYKSILLLFSFSSVTFAFVTRRFVVLRTTILVTEKEAEKMTDTLYTILTHRIVTMILKQQFVTVACVIYTLSALCRLSLSSRFVPMWAKPLIYV